MTHDYSHALNTKVLGEYIMSRVCLRWDQFFRLPFCNIWSCKCWTGPFEFRWLKGYINNPSYYHNKIRSIRLSHCCHICPWMCVWDGCSIIFCHLLHMYPGNTGTLFPLLMFSLWYLQMIGYICRVPLSADYTISLPSLCRLIWRHWITEMLSPVYALECVSKIKTILSIIFLIYGAVYLQFTQFSCDDRENVYFILLSVNAPCC